MDSEKRKELEKYQNRIKKEIEPIKDIRDIFRQTKENEAIKDNNYGYQERFWEGKRR